MPVGQGNPPPVVAVLGASGLIGSAVVAALASREVAVRAVSRRPAAVPEGARADIRVHRADLTRPGAVQEAVAGADAVIHLLLDRGGWRGSGTGEAGTGLEPGVARALLPALRERPGTGGPPTVVLAGTTTQRQGPPGCGCAAAGTPVSDYDLRKEETEELLLEAAAGGALRVVPLRLPTVFGPGPTGNRGLVGTMVHRAFAGEPLTLWHDGSVRREFLYVDDVADAFLRALDHADALTGRPWCLGSDRSERVGDVLETVAALVAGHTGRPPVPVVQVPAPEHAQAADFTDMVVDSSGFRAATGWRPRVPLEQALRRTVSATADRTPLHGPAAGSVHDSAGVARRSGGSLRGPEAMR